MNKKLVKLFSLSLACVLALGLVACGGQGESSQTTAPAGQLSMPADGKMVVPDGGGQEKMDPSMAGGTFKVSDIMWPAQEAYHFSNLGMDLELTPAIRKAMENTDLGMLDDFGFDEKGQMTYAYLSWNKLSDADKTKEIDKVGDEVMQWMHGLDRVATLGVFSKDLADKDLNEITRCKDHKELAETKDGKFRYVLSTNSEADQDLAAEMAKSKVDIDPIETLSSDQDSFSQEAANGSMAQANTISPLETKTLDGKTFTDKDFAKAELTMVNVFATTCGPCIKEMPDLEILSQKMKDKGVQVVGVVRDALLNNGEEDPEIIKTAKMIQEKTGVTYPVLLPDKGLFNGRLANLQAFPETFFVDKNGNIVGEPYSGSRSLEDWTKIVEDELAQLKK